MNARRTDLALEAHALFRAAQRDDAITRSLASEFGLVVLSVNYRLAPEHPFPAGLDDGFDNVAGRLDRVLDDVDGFLQRDRDAQLLVKQGATDRADDGRTNNRVGGLVGLDVVGELLHESLPFKRELLL